MKIATYNVNGIRAAIKKGLVDWLKEENPDILCIQEVKATSDQVPEEVFSDLGYNAYWNSAVKKGYSGVLTLSKIKADKVEKGISQEVYDIEGRVLRTDFGDWTLLNCYFPSGSSGDARHDYKMDFLRDFGKWTKKLLKKREQVIIVGDYNVVRLDIDIHNPERKDFPSGFKPEERKWMKDWFDGDFKDAYRVLHPDQADEYSWWSYRAGSRAKNKGWRIDYISVTNNLSEKIKDARHAKEAVHSDHVPVVIDINL
jgi:exodeoxyribonuclease-3